MSDVIPAVILVVLLGVVDVRGAESVAGERAPDGEQSHDADYFPWDEKGPLEFLEVLRERGRTETSFPMFTLREHHVGWVKESDLPKLVALVDSKEPCAHVRAGGSSHLAFGRRSFVGQEALLLIEGYRTGRYPPFEILSTADSLGFHKEKKRILAWWREHAAAEQGHAPDKGR